jgi:hypothetical protein
MDSSPTWLHLHLPYTPYLLALLRLLSPHQYMLLVQKSCLYTCPGA